MGDFTEEVEKYPISPISNQGPFPFFSGRWKICGRESKVNCAKTRRDWTAGGATTAKLDASLAE